MEGESKRVHVREVLPGGKAGSSKEGVFGKEEIETFLLWPPHWRDVRGGIEESELWIDI